MANTAIVSQLGFWRGRNISIAKNHRPELAYRISYDRLIPFDQFAFIGFFDGSEEAKVKSWFKNFGKKMVFEILNKYCPKDVLESLLEEPLCDQAKVWIQCLDVFFKQTDLLIIKDDKQLPYSILKDYPAIKVFVP